MDSKEGKSAFCTLFLLILAGLALADPITIDFNKCLPSQYILIPDPTAPSTTIQCCPAPPGPNQAIVDGLPKPSVPFQRMRPASQCTDQLYAWKLNKAYNLMRALPDSDPRSLGNQMALHCAYCGGSFYSTDANGQNTAGIDVHFGWLFFPWHRFFLYFHERILQSLLGDPTFSLNFWNWDNPYRVRNLHSSMGPACMTSGQDFPSIYATNNSGAFDGNRSQSALGLGRLSFPDLSFGIGGQPLANASASTIVQSNLNIIYQAIISGGTTTETFMGRPYRAGDLRSNPTSTGGGGSLELSAHAGVHFWTGQPPPIGFDMGSLPYAGRDPIFYAHHANIDRMFELWKNLGPYLGQNRTYYSDPDFLNATFLFYDETKTLRRVRVADALSLKNFGYYYQTVNDAAWIFHNNTKCNNMNYTQTLNQASLLPAPTKQLDGLYHLLPGHSPMVLIIDRPAPLNVTGADQILTINNISVNRLLDSGFDIYLDLPNPSISSNPLACAEYCGRFTNMRRSQDIQGTPRLLTWSQSVTETLARIGAPPGPSSVVVTILPITGNLGTITFSDATITNVDSSSGTTS